MKRIFDIIFSAAVIVFLSPVFLVIAILIKYDSEGAVFFCQQRVGKNGQLFWIYKFRTMVKNHVPNDKLDYVKQNDLRITRLGRILRNTSLDELPQFLNALKGDMSVVGPRPLHIQQVEYLTTNIMDFSRRHSVKPGITGMVQVSDMRSNVETLEEQRARLMLDIEYVQIHNFGLDMHLVLRTIWTMVARYNVSAKIYTK